MIYFSIQYLSNRFYCGLLFTKQILIVCPALVPQSSFLFVCIFQHRRGWGEEAGRRDASESSHGCALVKMQLGGRTVQEVPLQGTSPWINGTLLSCDSSLRPSGVGMKQWGSKTLGLFPDFMTPGKSCVWGQANGVWGIIFGSILAPTTNSRKLEKFLKGWG